MRIATPGALHEYVHASERELPEQEQTVFVHSSMTWKEKAAWLANAREKESASAKEESELKVSAADAYQIVSANLREIRGIEIGGERQDVADPKSPVIDQLPIEVVYGIAFSVINVSLISVGDAGKS